MRGDIKRNLNSRPCLQHLTIRNILLDRIRPPCPITLPRDTPRRLYPPRRVTRLNLRHTLLLLTTQLPTLGLRLPSSASTRTVTLTTIPQLRSPLPPHTPSRLANRTARPSTKRLHRHKHMDQPLIRSTQPVYRALNTRRIRLRPSHLQVFNSPRGRVLNNNRTEPHPHQGLRMPLLHHTLRIRITLPCPLDRITPRRTLIMRS